MRKVALFWVLLTPLIFVAAVTTDAKSASATPYVAQKHRTLADDVPPAGMSKHSWGSPVRTSHRHVTHAAPASSSVPASSEVNTEPRKHYFARW